MLLAATLLATGCSTTNQQVIQQCKTCCKPVKQAPAVPQKKAQAKNNNITETSTITSTVVSSRIILQ